MPYMRDGKCVYKQNADGEKGELVKCHDTTKEAEDHLAALRINVEAKEQDDEKEPLAVEQVQVLREIAVGTLRGRFPTVPPAAGVDLTALTEGDESPFFMTLPIARVGMVSTNGLEYDDELVKTLVEQINTHRPTGIMGHLKPEERNTAHPVPDVYWIGAIDDNGTAWAKGYLPPGPARDHYRRQKASGGRAATSIYGPFAEREVTRAGAAWRAKGLTLEQLDLAPYERAALKLGGAFAVTAEMDGGAVEVPPDDGEPINIEQEDKMPDKKELLAELTVDDIKALPLFADMRQAIIQEYQAEADAEKRVAELEQQVSDKDQRIEELEVAKKATDQVIAEFQAKTFDTDLDAKIAEMTAWETNGDEKAAGKVTEMRQIVKEYALAKLGDERDMEKATPILEQVIAEDLKLLVELTRDSLTGGPIRVPGKDKDAGTVKGFKVDESPEALREAGEAFGVL